MSDVRGQLGCRTTHRAEDTGRDFYGYSPCLAADQVH